ncbi:MAG TPA: hypothetical protein VLN45_04435, partial [Ignavibacteriaceae bacterium]|nr:hypothetical protein [Ignavibacteriaceae bacterium]
MDLLTMEAERIQDEKVKPENTKPTTKYLHYSWNPKVTADLSKDEGGKKTKGWLLDQTLWEEESIKNILTERSYILSELKDGYKIKDNVERVFAYALDFDKGDPSLDNFVKQAKNWQFSWVLHTTTNHRKIKKDEEGNVLPAIDRFRVLIPLKNPISLTELEDSEEFWLKKFPQIDTTCFQGNRYFMVNPDAEVIFHNFIKNEQIIFLDALENNVIKPKKKESGKKKPKASINNKEQFSPDLEVVLNDGTFKRIEDVTEKEQIFCPYCIHDKAHRTNYDIANAFVDFNKDGQMYIYCSSEDKTYWIQNKFEGTFWTINIDEDMLEVKIKLQKYINYLEREGFSKFYLDKSYIFIRQQRNFIEEYSPPQIKDLIINYIRNTDDVQECYRENLQDKMLNGVGKYFGEGLIECILSKRIEFKKDERDNASLYYKNGFVKVIKNMTPEFHLYDDLEAPIWKSTILDRNIKIVKDKTVKSEYEQFLHNVMKGDTQRFNSICSAIGYLLHEYKDASNAKAIVLCDEKISGEPNGRSGKSLIGKAINKIKKAKTIDGKTFEFQSRFTYQEIDLDTKVIDFNDVKKNFDFESLFSVLTDAMTIEYKKEKPVCVSFKDSPKFLISTNYTIKGNG